MLKALEEICYSIHVRRRAKSGILRCKQNQDKISEVLECYCITRYFRMSWFTNATYFMCSHTEVSMHNIVIYSGLKQNSLPWNHQFRAVLDKTHERTT